MVLALMLLLSACSLGGKAPESYELAVANRPVAQCRNGDLRADFYVLNGTANGKIIIKGDSEKPLATIYIQDGEVAGAIIHALGEEVLNPKQLEQFGNVCALIDKVKSNTT